MRTPRRRHLLAGLALAVLAGGTVIAMPSTGHQEGHRQDRPTYYFGTLRTDPDKARVEHHHGIDVAHLTIRWEQFEPEDGHYDEAYVDRVRDDLRTLREAGARVEVGIGIHHAPEWVYEQYPDAAFTDEHGDRYEESANIVFSQDIRNEVRSYIKALDEKIGLDEFWAVRVGTNETGEFTYPPEVPDDDRPGPDYWAYDSNAQQDAPADGRADGVPPNPYPGWRPGQREYHGEHFTREQAARWYDWYLDALADAVNWQQRTYRSLGYDGLLKVLVPGQGYYPSDYTEAVDEYFAGPDVSELIGLGAGFYRTIGRIRHGKGVEIVATSLVNGTGEPPANPCRPAADAAVDLDAADDSRVRGWSSVRWVTAIARREGFAVSGESAGPHVHPYYSGVMDDAAAQVRSCHLQGLMWAFDDNLYDGTPGSSLDDYAAMIRRLD
jgi:hypothetical protein